MQISQRNGWLWRPLLGVLSLSLLWLSDLRNGLVVAMFWPGNDGSSDLLYELYSNGLNLVLWMPAVAACYLVLPEIASRRWRDVLSLLSLTSVSSGALFLAYYIDVGQ